MLRTAPSARRAAVRRQCWRSATAPAPPPPAAAPGNADSSSAFAVVNPARAFSAGPIASALTTCHRRACVAASLLLAPHSRDASGAAPPRCRARRPAATRTMNLAATSRAPPGDAGGAAAPASFWSPPKSDDQKLVSFAAADVTATRRRAACTFACSRQLASVRASACPSAMMSTRRKRAFRIFLCSRCTAVVALVARTCTVFSSAFATADFISIVARAASEAARATFVDACCFSSRSTASPTCGSASAVLCSAPYFWMSFARGDFGSFGFKTTSGRERWRLWLLWLRKPHRSSAGSSADVSVGSPDRPQAPARFEGAVVRIANKRRLSASARA